MENIKKFLSKYGAAILFGLVTILFFAFLSIPFLNVIVEQTYKNAEGKEVSKELFAAFTIFSLFTKNDFEIIGNPLTMEANTFILAAFIITCVSFASGIIYFAIDLTKGITKGKKAYLSVIVALFLISLILLLSAEHISDAWPYNANLVNDKFIDPELKDIPEVEVAVKSRFNDYGSTFLFACVIIATFIYIRDILGETKFTTNEIVEFGVLIALSVILDKLPIFDLTVGAGSVNLSGIPLMILAVRHGPIKGLFASSVVFSLITCLIDGYGLQTLPFDYILAFSGYAVAGLVYVLFKKADKKCNAKSETINLVLSFICGGVSIFFTRMIFSTISSILLYQYALTDALIYNVAYVGPSAGFVTIICIALVYPIMLINRRFPPKNSDLFIKNQECKEN